MKFISYSEKQSFNFAKKFASRLKGGEIIGLGGELGAGKTIFAKGLAAGLGIKKNITSPTFALMKVYKIRGGKIKKFIHIDAYRLKKPKDIISLGVQEYFNRLENVIIIEWADKIKKILPKKTIYIKINSKGEKERIIIF
jgi:tRNA threonylcarbamoyladenosine biosynthesis protein TsaE